MNLYHEKKNFIGVIIHYGHLPLQGADNSNEKLWHGTVKVTEGHLAKVLWVKAKEEGMKVAVNWQDADSSSANSFHYSFDNQQISKIMLCVGHTGRAHGKKLSVRGHLQNFY